MPEDERLRLVAIAERVAFVRSLIEDHLRGMRPDSDQLLKAFADISLFHLRD